MLHRLQKVLVTSKKNMFDSKSLIIWAHLTTIQDQDRTLARTCNNGLFDLAATAGLETQSTYILHTEHKKI